MRILFSVILSTLPFLLLAQATPEDLTTAGASYQVRENVTDLGLSGVEVHYNSVDYDVRDTIVNGKVWHQLSAAGYQLSRDPGKPQVPVFGEMVMVPVGAGFEWEFTYTGKKSEHGYNVYPALAPATDRYGDPEPEFAIDSVTYSTDAFWPSSPVTVAAVQELRGMQIVWFDIAPSSFNPVTGELITYENISLKVSFSGAQSFMNYSDHTVHFLNNFPMISVNAGSIAEEIGEWLSTESETPPPAPPANYIILADSLFIDATNKLADWKRQLGFTVEVVAGTGWTFNSMQSAAHTRYQQWTPKPDYLLIVGDHDRMPAQMLLNPDFEQFGTDLHLVTMGGANDHIPEMAKGRISVASAAQAMTVVNKIINYEKNPPIDSLFYNTGLNCAQFQDDDFDNRCDRRFIHTSEEILDYLTAKGYDIKRVYYADTTNSFPLFYNLNYYSNGQSLPPALLSPTFNWHGNSSHINSHINNGVFYVIHRDHGYAGGTGWHAPYYVSSHINSLSNGNKTPVVFSINCHTGEFTLPECFAEKFLRHANGGAVGVVAASYYSYSGWNDGLSVGMFDAIWAQPGISPAFGSGGIFAPVYTPHNDIRNMGYVVNHGLLRMTQTWSTMLNPAKYQYRLIHYFGDPSMRIRTTTPAQITAAHADSMLCTSPLFNITNASYSNALATLTIPGRLLGKTTLTNGSGAIPVEPFSSPFMILTISGPEQIPYADTVWVIPEPLAVAVTSQNVRCKGKAEGEIVLDITCGIQPFTISWQHGPSAAVLENLLAGTYYFTVTDATSYSYSDSVTIAEPLLPLSVNGQVTDVICYYGSTGSVSVSANGGVPPYQYKWSNGSQSTSLGNIKAGEYIVSVTDQAGCVMTDTFVVVQPLPLQVDADIDHDAANNCTGEATALPAGGTQPYSYLWNDSSAQTTQTATGLCPGNFRVYVTDANGCITVRNVTILNTSGIEEAETDNILIFPNPLGGSDLFVKIPEILSRQSLMISLFNPLGQEIRKTESSDGDGVIRIGDFPAQQGIYMLVITDPAKGKVITRKILRL